MWYKKCVSDIDEVYGSEADSLLVISMSYGDYSTSWIYVVSDLVECGKYVSQRNKFIPTFEGLVEIKMIMGMIMRAMLYNGWFVNEG